MSIYVLIPLPTLKGGGKQVGHLKPCLFHRPATDPAGWTTARLSIAVGSTYKYSENFGLFHGVVFQIVGMGSGILFLCSDRQYGAASVCGQKSFLLILETLL